MDITTLIGMIAGFALMVFGIGTSKLGNFFETGSIIIVLGGTMAGVIAGDNSR